MIEHLSYSAISTYLSCPRQFEYRYIRKLPAILNGRMLAGRCYDHGVSYALRRKITGDVITADEIGDIVSDRWDAELSEQLVYDDLGDAKIEAKKIEWEEDEPATLKDTVLKLSQLYLRKMVPSLEPIAVQKRLEGVVGGVPMVGYPDCILDNGVIDHKFAKKRMPQKDADKDMQMSAYATLLQRPIWCAFHQALDQKTLDINSVLTERGLSDIDWFTGLVSQVWQAIQTGIFPPNPTTWRCSDTSCSYWIECRVLMED